MGIHGTTPMFNPLEQTGIWAYLWFGILAVQHQPVVRITSMYLDCVCSPAAELWEIHPCRSLNKPILGYLLLNFAISCCQLMLNWTEPLRTEKRKTFVFLAIPFSGHDSVHCDCKFLLQYVHKFHFCGKTKHWVRTFIFTGLSASLISRLSDFGSPSASTTRLWRLVISIFFTKVFLFVV